MRRRRRRRQSNAVSLFAFQDIMAAVIGVLFFLVLIMALDVVNKKAPAGVRAKIPETSELEALRESLSKRRDELQSLRKEVDASATKARFLSSYDPRTALKEVNRLNKKLAALYAGIRAEQNTLGEIRQQSQKRRQELQAKSAKLGKLKRRLAKLKEIVGTGASRPKVTYIVDDEGDELQPWLVEVSGAQIRVGAKDGRSATLKFAAKSFDVRKQQFLAWTKTQNNRSHYFVLLVKPSGIANAREFFYRLKGKPLGFHIGIDLLPETWVPFE